VTAYAIGIDDLGEARDRVEQAQQDQHEPANVAHPAAQ
jgi:hypothetical protein